MRIIFAGAQGTGKSTINKELSNILKLKSIDSMSEKFFKKDDLKNISAKNFLSAQLKIFAYASNEYLNQDNYISSRGFADSFAYCKHVYEKGFHIAIMNSIMNLAYENHRILDAIYFYLPIEFPLESKELRSSNLDFQKEIDYNIKYFLDITNTPYITVSGSIQERLDIILKILKDQNVI